MRAVIRGGRRRPTLVQRVLDALNPVAEAPPGGGRVRLRTLTTIRWLAILGQSLALAVVHLGLGYALPIEAAALVVLASVAVNLHAGGWRRGSVWLRDRAAGFYLGYDLIQLAVLLGLTGGLTNPFALLILAPVTVSASVLSRESTLALSGLAVAAITALAMVHLDLPWPGGLDLPRLYLVAIWLALVLATLFIAGYVFALAAEAQRMSDALSATQVALGREQRLSALDGLAAAAAHELGSPLGTIAVIARELEAELPADSPFREDAELLLHEAARCRDILARLARQPEGGRDQPFQRLPLSALAETAATPYVQEQDKALTIHRHGTDTSAEPVVARRPEILHGVATLAQNAARFAARQVLLEVSWSAEAARIVVADDGPGFPEDVLPHLGEPYISPGRQGAAGSGGDHMGLGVFIARTLLARTGARVVFANRPEGGADVTIRWARADLDAMRLPAPED